MNSALKRFYDRFVRLKGSPRQIALGFALGILIGMTPFWGTHIVLSLGVASLVGWNKIAAMAGVNITNVFTAPLIYPVNYWVGMKLIGLSEGMQLPGRLDWNTMLELIKNSPQILADMSLGGLILGVPLATASYVFALRAVRLYRRKRDAAQRNYPKGCLKSIDRTR